MRAAALAVCSIAACSIAVCSTGSPLAAEEPPDFASQGQPFLKRHCVACHGGEEPKAELSLEAFTSYEAVSRERKVWENVLKMVRAGEMPPPERPRPDAAEVDAFASHVEAVFDYADRHTAPDPGRVTMRRLNRNEYRNTVRDLLGADFDPTEGFPEDDIGHGFDNIGDVLTLSPLLMERYLDAAETISKRVIVENPPKPSVRHLAGRFLQPNNADTSQGRYRKLDPTAEAPEHSGPFTAPGGYLKFSADADLIYRATLYAEPRGDSPVRVALFIVGTGIEPSPEAELAKLIGGDGPRLQAAKILGTFEITARDPQQPQTIETPINGIGGIRNAGIAVVKPPQGEAPPVLHIEHLWSEGPLETRPKSQLMILASTAGATPQQRTREVVSRLLLRAYRRPPTDAELSRVIGLVEAAEAEGATFEGAMQQAIQVVLCSPKFLFRVELDDRPASPDARPLDDFQIASRLSYFLWSTMPDQQLFDLASQGKLKANLPAQVERMLADPKASGLAEHFALQWLQVRRLERVAPDAERFPAFDNRLRESMMTETRMFFESVMRENRSVLDLLDADYTFLDEPLARHYGIVDTQGNRRGEKPARPGGKPIRGAEFQRVALQDGGRGGLLTQGSVLTVTSNPTRTSPVKRGRWVLEQILGEPPPPPPPDVPELPEDEQAAASSTLRQRLEAHRSNPSCANCHAKMDPIGFALEHYDAVGAFRQLDAGQPIDASGQLPDGSQFTGAEDLKSLLRERKLEFTRCLTEKLLTYALGRGVEYYDRPTVEQIVAAVAADDFKFSRLITEIATSDPFTQRRAIPREEPADGGKTDDQ